MTDEVWQSFAAATWTDLAANLPGQAVRRQADELYAQWRAKPLVARWLTPRAAERRWRRGAEGEEVVARRLAALDSSWHVLHSVPVGNRDSDIDHVVIGPGGVAPAPAGQGIEPGAFAEIAAAIKAGIAYANVHTTKWPAGEIRGQLAN